VPERKTREVTPASQEPVLRVTRTKETARTSYDRMSRFYDLLAGSSEWKFVAAGLEQLAVQPGEDILEIGYGTGNGLVALAEDVGNNGRVWGIDLSEGMHQQAQARLQKAGLSARVKLQTGDAASLPYHDQVFDAVFTSFTLELFDTPEIPVVLGECRRVLRSGGRIGVVSMLKTSESGVMTRLYAWSHKKFPAFVDCRPIYPGEALEDAGFKVGERVNMQMWGLPVACVLANKV
jgi:ubiquinone/menaquinone biosynthesis C-methylase UbiE